MQFYTKFELETIDELIDVFIDFLKQNNIYDEYINSLHELDISTNEVTLKFHLRAIRESYWILMSNSSHIKKYNDIWLNFLKEKNHEIE
jgi:hypothetical protein